MTSAYEPDRPAKTPLVALAVLAVIVILAVTAGAWVPELSSFLPRSPDQAAAAAATERAIVANQTVAIPPERDASGRVTAETVERMRAEARKVAAQLFTGSYREQWIERVDAAIDVEASSEFVFHGGAEDFSGWRIEIEGDHARVRVRCRPFIDIAQTVDGNRTRAQNTVDYELTLQRVDGTWLVANETQDFAPGGGP
ncbi:MAG: hypothetical protein ABIZ52_07340 [Candidatus Limnocylindrales bacterium]